MTDQNDTVTHDLPTPGAGPAMRMLDVACIVASTTNPRKTFNQAKLAELAESIKASGVHQPILVRPLPPERLADTFTDRRRGEPLPTHELVAGERRWRGCKLANVAEIPAMIRELTDAQVLEIQIIENLQREDVSELEEAEGYEYLMQQSGLNAEEVGAKIGKSRSYVYARLKLTALCMFGRHALRDGKIDASKALLAARIPNEQLQIKAVQYMAKPDWQGDVPSYRECAAHVQHEYMLRLDAARFNITDVALVPSAGSCSDCSKRTGAARDLFADVKSADVCIDTICYHQKEAAHTERFVEEAKAKGQTVIVGEEAAELAAQGHNGKIKGYRRLDVAEDSPTDQPLRKIIGKQMQAEGIDPIKIENPRKKGELIDALPKEVVLRLLKAVEGQAKASTQVAKEVRELVNEKKAKAEAKGKAQYERAWRDLLIDNVWGAIARETHTAFSLNVHRYLALRAVRSLSTDNALAVADILGLGKVGAHSALIDFAKTTPSPDGLHLLVIMQCDSCPNDHSYGDRRANEGLMLVAEEVLKDRLPVVINDAQIEAAEKHLHKPDAGQTAAPKSASTPTPAAQASSTRDEVSKNGKGKNRPAAPARAIAPKTSKAEASAAIAAALNAADENVQAPAAQGNEAPPIAGAQAAAFDALARAFSEIDEAPAAQDNDVPPVASAQSAPPLAKAQPAQPSAPTAHTPGAGAQAPTATHGQDGADPQTGAAMSAGMLSVGVAVKVLPTANGKKQRPWHDYDGTVIAQVGPDAWDVSIQRSKKSAPIVVCFHSSELEVVL